MALLLLRCVRGLQIDLEEVGVDRRIRFAEVGAPDVAGIERNAVHRHRSFQPVRPGRTEIFEGARVHLADSALLVAKVAG